jgi:hypothetical protein
MIYQMVLHRPVELASVFRKLNEVAENPTLRELRDYIRIDRDSAVIGETCNKAASRDR